MRQVMICCDDSDAELDHENNALHAPIKCSEAHNE